MIGSVDTVLDVLPTAWIFFSAAAVLTLAAVHVSRGRSPLVQGLVGLGLILVLNWFGFETQGVRAQQAVAAREVISVGPKKAIKTMAQASKIAKAGALIEVDSGEYTGDVAVWTQENLTLRAVGGRVRLLAAGAAAEGKAIWVIRGGGVSVDGFDFIGARVPDQNGAGIRFEKGKLVVRNCSFTDNENGILAGNHHDAELDIENSEFGRNGHGDGQSHNLYVGAIARLSITGSYFHHANVGHLLKSRARLNHIFYNRFTDESGGRASYELEFANGGLAYVVGNIVQQGTQTENRHLISYGTEGYKWPKNELYLINNTLLNGSPHGGVFLRVRHGKVTVKAFNNLLVGAGKLESAGPGDYRSNFRVGRNDFELADAESYRLKRGSALLGKVVEPGSANGTDLQPRAEYAHRANSRAIIGKFQNPGALQTTHPQPRR